jgi:hypothetical protein
MDIKTPEPQRDEAETVKSDDAVFSDLNMQSLKGFFGVDEPSTSEQKMLADIYRYVSGDSGTDMASILSYLHGLKGKLGITPIGVTRIQHTYQYLKVLAGIRELEEEKKRLE